jgi:hypothetical protein
MLGARFGKHEVTQRASHSFELKLSECPYVLSFSSAADTGKMRNATLASATSGRVSTYVIFLSGRHSLVPYVPSFGSRDTVYVADWTNIELKAHARTGS